MKRDAQLLGQRGAATIEAILALLVFILVWVGVLYMGTAYSTKLALESRVRACAWIQSANSCSAEIECGTALNTGGDESGQGGLLEHFQGGGDEGFWDGLVKEQVDKLFGERATMSATVDIDRPIHLGGEQVSVSASYSLPCNTKPVTSETIAGQLIELVKEEFF